MEQAMYNKSGFEIEICSRCGGSGKHSFCNSHGDVCFKCYGTGYTPTKRGIAAKRVYNDLMLIELSEVKLGMYVKYPNEWVKVESIKPDSNLHIINGEEKQMLLINECYSLEKSGKIKAVRNESHRREILEMAKEYQTKLTKTGKLKKNSN
jgi:hypothetical protein